MVDLVSSFSHPIGRRNHAAALETLGTKQSTKARNINSTKRVTVVGLLLLGVVQFTVKLLVPEETGGMTVQETVADNTS